MTNPFSSTTERVARLRALNDEIIASVTARAAASPRRRANWNLHPAPDDPIQRFCNAIEPNSYVQPHRHVEPAKWEVFLALQGCAVVITFDNGGRLMERIVVAAAGPDYAVEIPPGAWHTVASLQSATVLFELKPGPYVSVTDKDFAAWAPGEGDAACTAFLEWFKQGEPGTEPPPLPGTL